MSTAREAILASLKVQLKRETVQVPEWDTEVVVQELNAAEHDAYEASMAEVSPTGKLTVKVDNHRCELLVRALRDGDGKRLFKDSEVGLLGRANSKVIQRLFEVAQRVTGISEPDALGEAKNA